MAESGYGRIRLFDDFAGPEIPILNGVAYGTTAGGCHYYIGPYKVTGDLGQTDTGIISVAKSGGWLRINGSDLAAKGCAVGTEVCLSAALNGPLAIEARVEMVALTTRVAFLGFVNVNADDVAEPVTSTGTALTLVATDLCGFVFDSQLTAKDWHMVYNGGTRTGETVSTNVEASELPAIAVSQILRLEIGVDGTAKWYIDGKFKQTRTNAVDPTALFAGYVGSFCTTTTLADIDCDYLAIEANRDWTV